MAPAIPHGSMVYVTEDDPTIGDVVAFRTARGAQLKRVRGVAGDRLGPELPAPDWCTWDTIPDGMLYVQADHGEYGSQAYGLVRLDRLIGVLED